jgi:hypothetical protein
MLNIFKKVYKVSQSNISVHLLGVFIFYSLLFSFYFFLHTFTSTDDQFFNIRLAQKISVEGFSVLQNFNEFSEVAPHPWVFNILFYYILIPFTWFHPLELGIKVFAVTSLALTFTILFFFLEKNNVKKAFLWLLLVVGFFFAPPDLWHFLMARAFVLVPALLVLLLYFLQTKNYGALFFLSFLSFFFHTATFFLPLVVGVIFSVFSLQSEKRSVWLLLTSIFGGTVAALLLGAAFIPGFLSVIWGFWDSLYKIVISFHVSSFVQIDEGIESYPTTLFDIFLHHAILIALLIMFTGSCVASFFEANKKRESFGNPVNLTLMTLSILFLLGTFITKRNLDFFFIFSILFLILSLSTFLETIKFTIKKVHIFSLIIVFLVALTSQILAVMDMIATATNHQSIQGVAQWAREHTEEGSVVFNPTMNFFPTFYFYNEGHNRVIVGIEPRDLYDTNQRKYWLWYNLSNYGVICGEQKCAKEIALRDTMLQSHKDQWYQENGEKAKDLFLNEFSTDLVLVRPDFTSLQSLLENSPSFEEVYATPVTRAYILYRVKDN